MLERFVIMEDEASTSTNNEDAGVNKNRRVVLKQPKFLLCLDKSRKKPTISGQMIMATLSTEQPACLGFDSSSSEDEEDDRAPKFLLADIQSLLAYLPFRQHYLTPPRWCRVVRPGDISTVYLVIMEGPCNVLESFCQKHMKTFFSNFYQCMEFLSPFPFTEYLEPDLFNVPIQFLANQERKFVEIESSRSGKSVGRRVVVESASDLSRNGGNVSVSSNSSDNKKSFTPIKICYRDQKYSRTVVPDLFSRTSLILSCTQLLEENYPYPGINSGSKCKGYKNSKMAYSTVNPTSPMFGLDCEMVVTLKDQKAGTQFELARITIVNERHEVIYDQLVKPKNKIVNYVTPKSGITASMLENVTKRLCDVQEELEDVLPSDAILVGQSMNCDLHAAKINHPFCIDTSVIFNLSRNRHQKCSLKNLSSMFLGRKIQEDKKSGHSSIEDAQAALALTQLKLSKSLEFGDAASGMWSPHHHIPPQQSTVASPPAAKKPRIVESPVKCAINNENNIKVAAEEGLTVAGDFHKAMSSTVALDQSHVHFLYWLQLHKINFSVVDREDFVKTGNYYPSQISKHVICAKNDNHVVELSAKHASVSKFCLLRLRDYQSQSSSWSELETKQHFWMLEQQLSLMYQQLPCSSLLLFMFPGQPGASNNKARCYFHLKQDGKTC